MLLAVFLAIVAVLVVVVEPAIRHTYPKGLKVKDSNQIKQIQQALLAKANENKGGTLPLPSRVHAPGATEDYSLNTTQNLLSMCIAQGLITPDLLINPCEINPHVRLYANYNFNAYQPAQGSYWDPGMSADIDAPMESSTFCNTSYAHTVLCGLRAQNAWRNTLDATSPQFSTRGVRDGVTTGPEFDRSPTLRICGTPSQWRGSICFADNHMEFVESFTPEGVVWSCDSIAARPDNIFAADFTQGACVPNDERGVPQLQAGGDAWLAICPRGMGKYTAGPAYDPLLPP